MRKTILALLLMGLWGLARADNAAFQTPVAPNGSSDEYAGITSSCVVGAVAANLEAIASTSRGVAYALWASSDALTTQSVQLYDSSSTVNCGVTAYELTPDVQFEANSATLMDSARYLPIPISRGVRFTDGLCIKITGTLGVGNQICAYFLEH